MPVVYNHIYIYIDKKNVAKECHPEAMYAYHVTLLKATSVENQNSSVLYSKYRVGKFIYNTLYVQLAGLYILTF